MFKKIGALAKFAGGFLMKAFLIALVVAAVIAMFHHITWVILVVILAAAVFYLFCDRVYLNRKFKRMYGTTTPHVAGAAHAAPAHGSGGHGHSATPKSWKDFAGTVIWGAVLISFFVGIGLLGKGLLDTATIELRKAANPPASTPHTIVELALPTCPELSPSYQPVTAPAAPAMSPLIREQRCHTIVVCSPDLSQDNSKECHDLQNYVIIPTAEGKMLQAPNSTPVEMLYRYRRI